MAAIDAAESRVREATAAEAQLRVQVEAYRALEQESLRAQTKVTSHPHLPPTCQSATLALPDFPLSFSLHILFLSHECLVFTT